MKYSYFLLFVLFVAQTACNNNTPENSNTPNNSARNTKPLTPEERGLQIRASREGNYDRTNVLEYLKTEPYCSIFGGMALRSNWAKTLSADAWVVLTPNDSVIKTMDMKRLGAMRLPENIKDLDAFIGDHIIITPINFDKPGDITELTTITGKKLKLQSGAQNVAGATYKLNQQILKRGGIVYITSMMTEYR